MAKVTIQLGKAIDVAHTDNIIEISGVGRLKFSKGSVEWISSPKSKNQRTFTWAQFRRVLENAGAAATVKSPTKKPPAKKKS